jgi:hypothetical protein
LHYAAKGEQVEIAQLLIEAGAAAQRKKPEGRRVYELLDRAARNLD